jgi:hypothetical protein
MHGAPSDMRRIRPASPSGFREESASAWCTLVYYIGVQYPNTRAQRVSAAICVKKDGQPQPVVVKLPIVGSPACGKVRQPPADAH